MIFCGQCGYQLSPGETTCPRCGAATDADQLENDPGSNNPTEISHAVLDVPSLRNRSSQARLPIQQQRLPEQQPLVLGSNAYNAPQADETTAMMNSQVYPPQQSYPNYPPQAGTGFYGYNAGGYPQQQQAHQSMVMAQMLETSRRGKTGALLLVLFGLLLLTGSVVVLLLTLQGVIFTT